MRIRVLSEAHYAAIGRVAANWSYFEAVVDDWSIRLAHITSEIGVCFTSQMPGSRAKLNAFIALADHLRVDPSLLQSLDKLTKETVGLSERRNRAVHDIWFLDEPSNPRRLEATAQRRLRLLEIPVPTDELLRLAAEILEHVQQFDELATRAMTEPRRPHAPGPRP